MGSAQAVGAGVASAQDRDAPARGHYFIFEVDAVAGAAAVLLCQEVHGKMYSLQLPPRHIKVSGLLRTAGQQKSIEFPSDRSDR